MALGTLAVSAWAPLAWWPMAPLAYGALFLLLRKTPQPLAAASLGLFFGLGLHLIGHSWVYTTLAGPVGMDGLSAALASALVMLGLALFTAMPCALYPVLVAGAPQPWLRAAGFASLMTAGEMIRGIGLDRFSSLSMGYAWIDTWLAGWAPALGVYGIGWLAYWMAAALAMVCVAGQQTVPLRIGNSMPAPVCLVAGWLLLQVPWTAPLDAALHFRLVQPNTAQGSKFDPAFKARVTQQVEHMLTEQAADLVVAPETAFPMYWNDLPIDTLSALKDFAMRSGSNVVFGIATVGSRSEGHNSMVHVGPSGAIERQYDKIHLFPFGEYAPAGLAWITRGLAIPMQDLSAGAALQAPFRLALGQQAVDIGTLVCNEIMLADEARRWAPSVHLLINPANMAWFDGTAAIPQGLQIARMRALEISRPILRVSNTGDTGLILASGALAQSLPAGQAASLRGLVYGRTGLTPYTLWGDWPVWAICLLSLVVCRLAQGLSRPRPPQSPETTPRYSQTG